MKILHKEYCLPVLSSPVVTDRGGRVCMWVYVCACVCARTRIEMETFSASLLNRSTSYRDAEEMHCFFQQSNECESEPAFSMTHLLC